jgi:DNA mismatch repair ATPase MutS
MCGIPYHVIDIYLARIVRAGLKAALAEGFPANPGITRRIE